MAVLPRLPDDCVDLVLVDPPYGTTACKWDEVIPLAPLWKELRRVMNVDAVAVFTAQQPFTSVLVASNIRAFTQALVWRKNKPSGHLNAKRRHLTAHEDIVVFYGSGVYNPQKTSGHRPANFAKKASSSPCYRPSGASEYAGGNTDRYPVTVLDFPVINNDGSSELRVHPTQKPLPLMDYLIRTYSHPGATVLDFAMGSGTTGVAAVQAGRKFIGIEKDVGFFRAAVDRLGADQIEWD